MTRRPPHILRPNGALRIVRALRKMGLINSDSSLVVSLHDAAARLNETRVFKKQIRGPALRIPLNAASIRFPEEKNG